MHSLESVLNSLHEKARIPVEKCRKEDLKINECIDLDSEE